MAKKTKKTEQKSQKREVGRPTKYDPKYCEMLIDHMAKGYSFESFGAKIDVHKETLYAWASDKNENGELKYPAFSEAKKTAYLKNLEFWETQGINSLWLDKNTNFNSTVWIFNMKNRHKWTDRNKEMSFNANVDVQKLSKEDALKLGKQALEFLENEE